VEDLKFKNLVPSVLTNDERCCEADQGNVDLLSTGERRMSRSSVTITQSALPRRRTAARLLARPAVMSRSISRRTAPNMLRLMRRPPEYCQLQRHRDWLGLRPDDLQGVNSGSPEAVPDIVPRETARANDGLPDALRSRRIGAEQVADDLAEEHGGEELPVLLNH
jgi:hypothetical protein